MGSFYWSPGMTIKAMEEQFVVDALKFYNGSKQSAANSLGITLERLEEVMKAIQLSADEQIKQDAKAKSEREKFLARSRGNIYFDEGGNPTGEPFRQASENTVRPAELSEQAVTKILSQRTPETAVPTAAVIPNAEDAVMAGRSGDPLSAARMTQAQMEENFPKD